MVYIYSDYSLWFESELAGRRQQQEWPQEWEIDSGMLMGREGHLLKEYLPI